MADKVIEFAQVKALAEQVSRSWDQNNADFQQIKQDFGTILARADHRDLKEVAPLLTEDSGSKVQSSMSDNLTNYRLDQAEKRAEKADERMGRIEDKIDDLKLILVKVPTKGDLLTYTLASAAIGLTILALVVGGIIGGLDWVKVH